MISLLNAFLLLAVAATCVGQDASFIQLSRVSPKATATTKEMAYEHKGKSWVVFVESEPIVTEKDIAAVEPGDSPDSVKIILTEQGEKKFDEGIKDMYGMQLAFIFDGRIVSAPTLHGTAFGRELPVVGNLTQEEAAAMVRNFAQRKGSQTP